MLDEDNRAQGWRLGVLVLLIFAGMGMLLSRLWNVQIVNSESARHTLEINTEVKARIAPARGKICDRNGLPLAENRPSFDIDFYLDDLQRDYAESHHGRRPVIHLRDGKNGKKRDEIDIVQIVKESIEPISQTLGLTAPLNEKEIKEHFRTDKDLPYHYMTDLDFATVAQFAERNLGVAGIAISQNPVRSYTYGALAAHILGYVGTPLNRDEHMSSDGTISYETVGRHGIEAIMDPQLQGEPGTIVRRVSSQGYYIGDPLPSNDPTMGNSIYLTIDARVQYIVETAVRHSPWTRAAVVVMDPRNGDVLALASFPNYDPNKFIPRINSKDWDALNSDPTAPLFNRALHNCQPGSTYKIMVALAGLKSGNATVNTEFDCPGDIWIDDHDFHNSDHAAAGTMSLVNAIKVSSDTFFYQYGMKVGMEAIDAMGKLAGFGHKWGLLGDADEDAGTLPGPEWMKDPKIAERLRKAHAPDHWSRAQTALVSIGQGFVQVTPLQMATFLCAVANGGTVYQPRLYSRVVSADGKEQPAPMEGQVYSTLDVKPSDMKAVQEGMREVVEEDGGTGHETVYFPGVQLAGKTGTAQGHVKVDGQFRGENKCWFYCYGPFESPRYVCCVMVEGGIWGATAAGPIAKEIMQRLFAMDAGQAENVAYLQPAQGNFNGAGEVNAPSNDNSKPADNGSTGDNDSSIEDMQDSSTPTADAPPRNVANPRASTKHAH